MADFEDASSPVFANMIEGQANLKDRWAGTIGFTDPATGKAYALKDNPAALMVRPRGWHLHERHVTVDGAGNVGRRCSTSASMSSIAPRRRWRRARRPPSICRRWKAISRRGCGTTFSRTPRTALGVRARDVQGDGADRDAAGGVRDGRDPATNCATTSSASTAAAGTTSSRSSSGSARTRAFLTPDRVGDDDGQGVPQRLFAAADQDLPPPRRLRHGRHGGADPGQGRRRAPTRPPSPRCAPTRSARPATATTAPGSPIPTSCRSRMEVFDRLMPGPNQLGVLRDDVDVTRGRPRRDARGQAHRRGPAREHPRRRAIYRGLAARPRRRADLQPDGGRRDRGNLARPGLAVDPSRRRSSTTAAR